MLVSERHAKARNMYYRKWKEEKKC
jgi:hypothetical protein